MRLNKLLAERGVGARRKCDALIQSGEVRVDGRVVTEPGSPVDPSTQAVTWRGKPLPKAPGLVYLMINKPGGMLTTLHDPEGRRTVLSLLPPRPRLFPVGRLDASTTGLLIATNDGALAHRLMHPRYGVTKVYRMTLGERPNQEQLAQMERGVRLEDGQRTAPARVRVRGRRGDHCIVDLSVHEGRYHLVRQMCQTLGMRLLHLQRVAYGPLRLGELKVGRTRPLALEEVRLLRTSAKQLRDAPARGKRWPASGVAAGGPVPRARSSAARFPRARSDASRGLAPRARSGAGRLRPTRQTGAAGGLAPRARSAARPARPQLYARRDPLVPRSARLGTASRDKRTGPRPSRGPRPDRPAWRDHRAGPGPRNRRADPGGPPRRERRGPR